MRRSSIAAVLLVVLCGCSTSTPTERPLVEYSWSVDKLHDQEQVASRRSMLWAYTDPQAEQMWDGYAKAWRGLHDMLYFDEQLHVDPSLDKLDFHADALLETEQRQLRSENAKLILTDGVPSVKK